MRVNPFLGMDIVLFEVWSGRPRARFRRCKQAGPGGRWLRSDTLRALRIQIRSQECVGAGGPRLWAAPRTAALASWATWAWGLAWAASGGMARVTVTERGATLLTSLHRAQPDSAGVTGRLEPFSPWCAAGAGTEQQERRAWMLGAPESWAHWASMARWVAQIPGMNALPEATR